MMSSVADAAERGVFAANMPGTAAARVVGLNGSANGESTIRGSDGAPPQADRIFGKARVEQATATLSGAGFEILGRGDDACAMALPDAPWAIRLSLASGAYTRFVSLTLRDDNVHFPTYWGHRDDGLYSLSIMERLKAIDRNDGASWTLVQHAAGLAHALNDRRPWQDPDGIALPAALAAAATALGDGAHEHDYALDFGCGNTLRRPGTREIVFIDPWVPWGD